MKGGEYIVKELKTKLANTFGLAMAIIWILCSTFVWLLPGFSMQIAVWWMHGMDLSALGDWNLTMGNFIYGGGTAVIASWISGWIIGWSWEKVGGAK